MLSNLFRDIFVRKRELRAAASPQDAVMLAARDLLAHNRFQEVIDTLAPLLQRGSQHAEALFMRGTAALELQRVPEAMADLERAVALSPREPRYLFNLALAHWITGDTERTIQLCNEAVRIAGFHAAHVMLANIELHGEDYFHVLARLHAHLKPRTYLEVGVFRGASLRIVPKETLAIGVDPEPILDEPPGPNQFVIAKTSDDYFASHDVIAELGGRRLGLAFIDGMHKFEYALRDFINIERLARPDTVVLVHDCYPLDARTAERERATAFWSGDIWRLILLLRKYRPDLGVHTISTPPTGLGMILNLDPSSRVLADKLEDIVAEYLATDYGVLEGRKRELLNAIPNDWSRISALLDSRARPT
jgi:hypothetical protein